MADNLRLEWIDPATLNENPQNWRRHPARQADALRGAVNEVGWAGALLYNEATGHLIDGHLRRELYAGTSVPVLVGSWTEEQERLILATLDPIGAMAEADTTMLAELLQVVDTAELAVRAIIAEMAAEHGIVPPTFAPVEAAEMRGLDQAKRITCPHCGASFEYSYG